MWIAAGVSLAGVLLFGRHVLVGVFTAQLKGVGADSVTLLMLYQGPAGPA